MNKTAVVFKSKYGATKQYSEWIADQLACDLFERDKIKVADLLPYDTIIYGGGLYAGGVSGIDLITKQFKLLRGKNLILFTCGLADPADQGNTGHIKKSLSKVFTDEMQETIKVFHLRGHIDYKKLGFIHRAMMAMLRKMLVKKEYDSLRSEDKEFLES